MSNPFANRSRQLNGPASDIRPVTPSDTQNFAVVAIGLYVETGGALSIVTVDGQTRSVNVADHATLRVGVSRVNATGTTAEGIHALTL